MPFGDIVETHAVQVLCECLEKEGFQVEREFISRTGFRAKFSTGVDEGMNAGFVCEYDAVGELGHAAGHNLQAASSVACAIAVKKCMEKGLFKGQVTVLGTPGEDCGHGSKIEMLHAGAFEDVDFCMLLAPYGQNILYPKHFHLVVVEVNYIGKASHASAAPWEGRNALDAAVSCYTNVALLRQQMRPDWHINGIISKGGSQPNVVPQEAQLKFWLRAPEQPDLVLMQLKCQACFVAAAKATGCEVAFEFEDKPNYAVSHDSTMAEIFQHEAQQMGITFSDNDRLTHIGSTDMGNVSQAVPTIFPAIDIGTGCPVHSEGFTVASGTDMALERILKASEALAVSVSNIMGDQKLADYIRTANVTLNEGTSNGRVRALSQNDAR